jgi:hypothetical protein
MQRSVFFSLKKCINISIPWNPHFSPGTNSHRSWPIAGIFSTLGTRQLQGWKVTMVFWGKKTYENRRKMLVSRRKTGISWDL